MKYIVEQSLRNFEFWSGARENVKELTLEQLDEVEPIVEEVLGEECTDTQINDLFWFEFDTIKEWLGINEDEE